jgi:hypothetical protein
VHKIESDCYHKKHTLTLLISLIIHLLILWLILSTYKPVDQKNEEKYFYHMIEEEEPLASTNPSSYTHPSIMLVDDAPPAPVAEPVRASTTQNQTQLSQAPSALEPIESTEPQEVARIPPTQQEIHPVSPDLKISPADSLSELLERIAEMTAIPDTSIASSRDDKTVKTTIPTDKVQFEQKKSVPTRTQKPSEIIKNIPTAPQQKAHAVTQTSHTQTPPSRPLLSEPSKRMMRNIAASFLHAARDEREHEITIIGDPRRMPTAEQLKQERYLARLQQCIYTSHITLRSLEPKLTTHPGNLTIRMKLNRDGSISDLTLIRPSLNPEIDRFFMLVFKDAGRSFPPLPSYLTRSYYICTWTVINS